MLIFYLTLLEDEKDKCLFEEIYYSYRKQMVSLSFSILHSKDEAEDVVQDVFLLIATKYMNVIKNIDKKIDLRNYLLKATKNTSLNYLKQKNRLNISIDTITEYDLSGIEDLSDETFVEMICNRVEYDRIVKAIMTLSDKYRDVLYFHFVLELTVSQTADILKQTILTTKKQLFRGKKMLLDILRREGD